MSMTAASAELPIWPSGIARFADGILEVTTGDGIRVAAADIVNIAGQHIGRAPAASGRWPLDELDSPHLLIAIFERDHEPVPPLRDRLAAS
jgi:hypothetical protein